MLSIQFQEGYRRGITSSLMKEIITSNITERQVREILAVPKDVRSEVVEEIACMHPKQIGKLKVSEISTQL
jgi:hypothetical protein